MKSCIFLSVFTQDDLVPFFLLLESIGIYSNITEATEILIYTNSELKTAIKNSQIFSEDFMKIIVNDTIVETPIFDFFKLYGSKESYNKILYIDNTVLIKRDIQPIFDIISDNTDILYVGGGFSSSAFKLMLFSNSDEIHKMFMMNTMMFSENKDKINSEELQRYISPDLECDFNNKTIAITSVSQKETLSQMIEKSIAQNIENTKNYIQSYLMPIIHEIGEPLEGNIFFYHECISKYCDDFISKCKNISYIAMNKLVCKNAIEIGYNSGFSSLLMLMSNSNLKITCFDIAMHKYTVPCYTKISSDYGERISLIIGDSKETFTAFVDDSINRKDCNYNYIHVDGCHLEAEVISDIKYTVKLSCESKTGTHIIIDDYDSPVINSVWHSYLNDKTYNIEDSKFYLEKTDYQDIKFLVVKN